MRTIGQIISDVRGLIKVYGRNPEGYTDEGLYSLFSVSRADLLKQKLDKFKAISEDNWYQICMGLEKSKSHNCDCVPDGLECLVLKSKYKIPTVLTGRNISKIRISTIGGKQINLVTEAEWRRKKDKEPTEFYGSIINSYLILWNHPLTLRVILINGIWFDPLDLQTIPNCAEDGSELNPCFDPMTSILPLDGEYLHAAYKKTLELLNIPLQLPQDQTNDSNEFVKM